MMKNGTLNLERWTSGDKTYGMKDPEWEEEVEAHRGGRGKEMQTRQAQVECVSFLSCGL